MRLLLSILLSLSAVLSAYSEDGYRLWLPQDYVGKAKVEYTEHCSTMDIAASELSCYWNGDKAVLHVDSTMEDDDSYRIDSKGSKVTISGASPRAVLYGTYDLLRCQECKEDIPNGISKPAFRLRMLNHWDNIDGSIERGYAGKSIWKWDLLEHEIGSEYTALLHQYARANASIGINAVVLNNVNAQPQILTTSYIKKVKIIADILRDYGIQVFLSVNFATPLALHETTTADPLNDKVAAWWKKKADEIYSFIPDFGGFLVKANSEGQPGPGDYNRSHADGANMLAAALKPHNGIVIWRCFVYGNKHKGEDRVMQAVTEFKHLDGQFAENVILQSKNGPLDFQPREPYSPIFDQITKTPLGIELQITQEYTGQSKHLVYLAPIWKEFFSELQTRPTSLIAGVANIGDDRNWCGHPFSQANWYAFGRLAWNPELSSKDIAKEWILQTFRNEKIVDTLTFMMEQSREACVNYMMPLGMHHIFKFDHHYGPEPDGFKAEYPIEWCPVYYHKADKKGVGFNRSMTGTKAVSQYRKEYRDMCNDIKTCPENLLLWFHHVPWTYKMKSGNTLWQEMQKKYNEGVDEVGNFQQIWTSVKPYIDAERYEKVDSLLRIQYDNAKEWRDVCLGYFGKFAKGK